MSQALPEPDPGLCASCVESRRITSGRGSTFWYCRLAERDPSFPKYPALPVLSCRGYSASATKISSPG